VWQVYLFPLSGLLQLEFQLNEEPELGNYRISMVRSSTMVDEYFEVKEYGMYFLIGICCLICLIMIGRYLLPYNDWSVFAAL